MSIPKAILRKSGPKKPRADNIVHNYYPKASTSSVGTSIRRPEMEDQTVITVLEPEGLIDDDQRFWSARNGITQSSRQQKAEFQKSGIYLL